MSLINDALKKAARQRAEEQADVIAPMPGGGSRSSRQGGPVKKQTMVLIGAAAIALIVVSVVLTGMFMTGKSEPKPVADARPAAPAAAAIVAPAPAITVALPPPSVPTPAPTALPQPTPAPAAIVLAPEPAAPVQAQAPLVAPVVAPAVTTESHTEIVQGVVDRFHISGVRTAGADSKALVDGHVYKVNDLVDRSLGLRLTTVEADHLTFVDREGNTFVKSF